MRVSELLDILRDQEPDAEVELAIVEPSDGDVEMIGVTRYVVEGVYPRADEDSGDPVVWLIGGDDADDVDALFDALDEEAGITDDGDGHDHEGDHAGHDHGPEGHDHPH